MFRLYLLSCIFYPLNPKILAACGVTEDKILRIWEIQISFEKTSQSEELTSNTMWAILRQTLRPILEKHKMWNTNCEIQNWKIQNEKYKFRNTEWEIQIEKYKLWHRKIETWTNISSEIQIQIQYKYNTIRHCLCLMINFDVFVIYSNYVWHNA